MAGATSSAEDYSALQNRIKRDPEAYKAEFTQQFTHYHSLLDIVERMPQRASKQFQDLVNFLAHVSPSYPKETADVPTELMGVLERHYPILEARVRRVLVRSLILMRNRGLVDPLVLLTLFFKLFRCNDKHLRRMLFMHIVNDIRNTNKKRRNNKLNNALQGLLYSMLQDRDKMAAKLSLDVIITLYRKNVWTDAKTVNVISTACLTGDNTKMLVAALKFFVSDNDLDVGAEDPMKISDEMYAATRKEILNSFQHGLKTKGRQRKVERALKRLKRRNQADDEELFGKSGATNNAPQTEAIDMLYDPQGFAEKLFTRLRKSRERFEVRIMMMDLLARIISMHELLLLNYYPFMQRYMQPHQQHVTLILTIVAQACHPLVPPDVIEPVLQTLVYHFVTDRSSADVMTVGLNTAREISRRTPLAMTPDLLQDLVQYKNSKFKGVAMAARSLVQLFRVLDPEMLKRRDRGKEGAMRHREMAEAEAEGRGEHGVEKGMARILYGRQQAYADIPDAELLQSLTDEERKILTARIAKREGGGGADSDSEDGSDWCSVSDDPAMQIYGEGAEGGDDDGEVMMVVDETDLETEELGYTKYSRKSKGWRKRMMRKVHKSNRAGRDDDDSDDDDDDDGSNGEEGQAQGEEGEAQGEEGEPKKKSPLKRKRVTMLRSLTDEDFALIRYLREKRATETLMGPRNDKMAKKRARRQADEDFALAEMERTYGERVDQVAIEKFRKRRKLNAAERKEWIAEGREEFQGQTFRQKKAIGQSLTNAEKSKTKNFMMMRAKRMQSARQRQDMRARGTRIKGKNGGAGRKRRRK